MQETRSYNALAVAVQGDRQKLARFRKKFSSWEETYEVLAHGNLPTPDIYKEWNALEQAGIHLLLCHEETFPPLLKEITDSPFGLYIKGVLPPTTVTSIAVVGTRRATPEGKRIASNFGHKLASARFAIVSGLAFGIDAAAHDGTLEGNGRAIAVLAGGLHDIYPREHKKLAEKILATGGAIVSEYPLGAPPYPDRFLERNRLISGLSRGTVIIEAPVGSGALATARYALEENRDVFVVPGPSTHPNFAGSHHLIRQGAELVTAPEEILEAYGVDHKEILRTETERATPEEKQVLEALQKIGMPADVDKISAATTLEPRIVNRAIAFLLMKTLIKEEGGGYTI